MKKIFTLITMAILAMSANAQSWDFTKTQVTAEQIAADATNWEVTNDTRYTYLTATNKEALKLGTDELPDTKGLLFTGGEKKFRLDVNQRLGLNGKNLSLTIPGLKAGQTVTVKAKSANTSEARGFTVENITPVSGFFNSTSTDEQENVGTVTADGDVTITTTAGMNVFSITVEGGGNNDDPTPGGETGETEKYVAVTADGQLAPEFAAVIGEGNVATNVVDHNSIVKVETKSITLEAVRSGTEGDAHKGSGRLRLLFPPVSYLKARYPYLTRHPYLLPAAWAARLVHYAKDNLTGNNRESAAMALQIGKSRTELLRKYHVIP